MIPGVVRCAVQGSLANSQPWTNIVHCRYAGGASSPGDSDLVALDALLVRLWVGAVFGTGKPWFTKCTGGVTLTKISYVRLNGTSLGLDLSRSLAGSGAGSALPAECAPVLTLRSNQRGRSYRGRIYLPAPSGSYVDGAGRLQATFRDETTNQMTGLMAALGGPSTTPFWELGIASYLHASFIPLATPTMDLDIDVQTRRKR